MALFYFENSLANLFAFIAYFALLPLKWLAGSMGETAELTFYVGGWLG